MIHEISVADFLEVILNNPKFNALLDRMKEMHDKKNADYANDSDPYSNFTFAASLSDVPRHKVYLTLIGVKIARLNELLGKKEPKNESINDTLLDLAVYTALMASDLMNENNSNYSYKDICSICNIEILSEFISIGNGTRQNPFKRIHVHCKSKT